MQHGGVTAEEPDHEFVIIGAGIGGLHQLHRLRELGRDVVALERHPDVGGTWYRNRYPGCRFDSESFTYGYSFSEELLRTWDWSEMFAARAETLRYLENAADVLGLRPHIRFDTSVTGLHYDDERGTWRVEIAGGGSLTCRYVITAVGNLSVPTSPRLPGAEEFRGRILHTEEWPHEGIDLAGKRVAVVGTGATGIQVISTIAPEVERLTVFQRRPSWSAPLSNRPLSATDMADIRARYDEIFARCAETPGGFLHGPVDGSYHDATPEERRKLWDDLYDAPGFGIWIGNYREILTEDDANADFSAYIAERIRGRVDDPAVADLLIPTDHGFGVQRVPLETNYYETYNRDNVELVDLFATPIERLTADGAVLGGREIPLDVIVFATGFDAITGGLTVIDITGRGGLSLREEWADGPRTAYGMQVPGFPNLFTLTGPLSASGTTNFPRAIETCVDWVTDLLVHMDEHGYRTVEAGAEVTDAWYATVARTHERLVIRAAQSWFTGVNHNIPGRDRPRLLMYLGGAPRFRAKLAEVAASGYDGFSLSR